MKWTKEKPTEPGWYWWEEDPEYAPRCVRVLSDKRDGHSIVNMGTHFRRIDEIPGRFAGPIEEPED